MHCVVTLWLQMLTGSAICSFGFLGFIGIMPQSWGQNQARRLKVTAVAAALLVMFLSYSAVAVVVSLMVQFQ
jgi:amino acid transporter